MMALVEHRALCSVSLGRFLVVPMVSCSSPVWADWELSCWDSCMGATNWGPETGCYKLGGGKAEVRRDSTLF